MEKRRAALFAIGTAAGAAALGSVGARDAAEVYPRLEGPAWAPPREVFGPVWTVLYVAIGLAGWRLARRPGTGGALVLHVLQLTLNAAWPFTFFSARNRAAALAVVVALDVVVAAEIVAAARRDRTSAALLAPYLAWNGYATALTAAVEDPARV